MESPFMKQAIKQKRSLEKLNSQLRNMGIAVMFLALCSGCQSQVPHSKGDGDTINTQMNNTMQEINLADWIGKSVGELLGQLGDYDELVFVDTSRPGVLGGANYRYGEKWLMIKVASVEHQAQFNARRKWDPELFRKETISEVSWEN